MSDVAEYIEVTTPRGLTARIVTRRSTAPMQRSLDAEVTALLDGPTEGPELMTNSRLTAARTCQRLHHIEYVLGFRPAVKAAALRFGTLFHNGLEAWWLAKDGERLPAAVAAINADTEADPYDIAKALVMMAGYDVRWANEPYDILGVEVGFECALRNPATGRTSQNWILSGKIDAIVRDRRDGLVRLVEHKTSSEDITPGSEYWRRLRMDSQISVYFEGATHGLGYDIAACLYDVIKKPALKPLQVNSRRATPETPTEYQTRIAAAMEEDPGAYFVRGEIVRLESELEESLADVWHLAQQTRESELAGRAPRNPSACVRYGRTCPYFAVCTGEASLSDAQVFTKLETKHPELTAPAESPKERG